MKNTTLNLLEGISLIDFTTRLPGPLASLYLSKLGASIFRPEGLDQADAFKNHKDIAFQYWFNSFSKGKVLLSEQSIQKKIEEVDGIITTWTQTKKYEQTLNKMDRPFVILEIQASSDIKRKSLHDLNALADSGLLRLHINDEQASPPFLPFAGIQFANQIALTLLAAIIKSQKHNQILKIDLPLDSVIKDLSHLILPPTGNKFLHNGKFPCYQIYKTLLKNKFLVVAAIELKFWEKFAQSIDLPEIVDLQHSADKSTFELIQKKVLQFSEIELEQICQVQSCISLVSV